jgi:hypothetical protein
MEGKGLRAGELESTAGEENSSWRGVDGFFSFQRCQLIAGSH